MLIQPFVYNSLTTTPSRFSDNSEANASELSENLEEMISLYYMHSDIYVPGSNLQLHTNPGGLRLTYKDDSVSFYV